MPFLLWTVATAILAQAVLAGMFISGLASVRPTHMILGSMLPYFAVIVPVVGIVGWLWPGRPA